MSRLRSRWLPAVLLLVLTSFWFAVRSVHGIHFLSFGDESGHFLGARAMRAGDRLYRDFIDAHGPLNFMAAQVFGVAFGWKEPLNARWGIVLLAILTAVSVYRSPVFRHHTNRLWGAAIFLGLISAPWLVQSLNMLNYHVLGGFLATMILAGLVIPAWFEESIPDICALLAGFCLALLCADAYSLAPTAVLLTMSAGCALWNGPSSTTLKRVLRKVAIGFAAGLCTLLIWMLCFGDIVGYLVFHIISNQLHYSKYSSYGWSLAVHSLVTHTSPNTLVQSGAAITFLFSLFLLAVSRIARFRANPVSRLLSLIFLFAAILMTNFRGGFGFQDGSFLVASIAMFALALPVAMSPALASLTPRRAWIGSFVIGLLLCVSEGADRAATMSAFAMTRQQATTFSRASLAVNYQESIYGRIRSILKPGERLLVLEYDPDFYLRAGFLPFRKYHEYLPWEADYARDPWFGRTRDLCADVAANLPPVIVYTYWKVWNRYSPETFMACIPAILKKNYVADAIPHLFIRRDRMPAVANP